MTQPRAQIVQAALLDNFADEIMRRVQATLTAFLAKTKQADGSTVEQLVELDGEAEQSLLALLKPANPETKTIPRVDLRPQVEVYLAEGGRREQTTINVRRSIEWYLSLCEREGLAYDSRQAAASFKAWLQKRDIRPVTINVHLGRVSKFMKWAMAHFDAIDRDALAPVKLPKARSGKQPPTDKDKLVGLLAVMDPAVDSRCWALWILAYTGMRVNEACQLRLEDIRQVEGIWCFDVDGRADADVKPGEKQVKNDGSKRLVPVHSHLLELGLLEHIDRLRQDKQVALFSSWQSARPGKNGGRWLREYLGGRSTGSVHGVRRRVLTDLIRADVPELLANELLGHTPMKSEAATYYSGAALPKLKDAIEVLDYRS